MINLKRSGIIQVNSIIYWHKEYKIHDIIVYSDNASRCNHGKILQIAVAVNAEKDVQEVKLKVQQITKLPPPKYATLLPFVLEPNSIEIDHTVVEGRAGIIEIGGTQYLNRFYELST